MDPSRVFDAEGYWIAFIVGKEVFLRGGEWLGRLTADNEIRDQNERLRGFLDTSGCLSIIEPENLRMSA
jgi:hypothetical protein